jgi:hypothetical protein
MVQSRSLWSSTDLSFESNLGLEFRMECLTNANVKANHTLHTTTGKVLAAKWFCTTPDVSSLQPFGQHGYFTHALKYCTCAKLKTRAYRDRLMSRVGNDIYRVSIEATTLNNMNIPTDFRTIRAPIFVP